MPQFLIPHGGKPGDRIRLSSDEAHHLRDILRMEAGEKIRVTDGQGNRFVALIHDISGKEVEVSLQEALPPETRHGILNLGLALLKREKMEWVIQKSAELGVASLLPFSSSRTVATFKGGEKLSRWQKISDGALKQCGREIRMTVKKPVPFVDLIRREADLKIIFWEEGGEPVREFFRRNPPIPPLLKGSKGGFLIVIGPEGGLSRQEIAEAKDNGFVSLSLGQQILRAETAAIVAISLIQYELENF